jgi:hypothetical protein
MNNRMKTLLALLLFGSSAAASGYDAGKPNPHEEHFEHYEGTRTCLECHEDEALTFFDSQHYQWRGRTPDLVNTRQGQRLGKLTMVNDFCTNPGGSQWIGKVRDEEGTVLAKGCSGCHAGLGKLPGPEPTTEQLENIDCLMCHASGYRRDLYQSEDGEWEWRPILWKNQEGLDSVSKRISLPDRSMCLRCHTASGGGPNFKRGAIEYVLKNPPREHDAHMSSDGPDLTCIDCHTSGEHSHRVIGRGVDLAATDKPDSRLDCAGACHSDHSHKRSRINKHMDRVACVSCHIPEFARDTATDMRRDWSDVHFNEEKGKFTYSLTLEKNVKPHYAWFNGKSWIQVPGQEVRRNAAGEVTMALPEGSREDENARIYPFKLHRGVLPVLNEQQWISPITTEELYHHGNPDKAVTDGAKNFYGIEDASFTWTDTVRYMGIFHGMPPADQALTCRDCHAADGRMDWEALGYDKNPMPMKAKKTGK